MATEQMLGQLRLFEHDSRYTFMRNLKRGDVYVIGTPDNHSARFTVTANRPGRQAMGVEYVTHTGERKTTTWTYRDHDVCIVVEQGKQTKREGTSA